MSGLEKFFARSQQNDPRTEKAPTTSEIKVAVAAYSIQRRVLETLHRTLLAELRQAHNTELENFKDDLRLQAAISQTTRSLSSQTSKNSSTGESATPGEGRLSTSGRVHRRMEITKFQLLQAKERRTAGKHHKEEIHRLRKEHGDIVIPEKNGGITEADCPREINTILVNWGLTAIEFAGETHRWEDDLEDMVGYYVQCEQEERKRRREARSVYYTEPESLSASTRPRRLYTTPELSSALMVVFLNQLHEILSSVIIVTTRSDTS
ncbi:hypothetical protein BDP55DRAFT_632054 [Colletotrichum godetiae]|uniref:Uncharacterized protein n=1 Tax=Colletotrichum godetiae TaxID=1209918 RepID=A0AAJ0ALE7_9PEZI|nr:uncharacterized protein BDP55DRAFT_632054 [Colletotrichum godetiae]KAK1675365.1 hypothetical protein BDP55DRAFT_632054 [Colletotrichum godetiae]